MRKRPKSVVILGNTYNIEYLPEKEMKNLYGDVVFEDKLIRIRKGLSDIETHNTLLHEIIHVVLHDSGMAFLISDKLDEGITRALENGLGPLVTLNTGGRVK